VPVWIAFALMAAFVAGLGSLALWLLHKGVGLRS
jgi:ABC-2 type transport system permease protein